MSQRGQNHIFSRTLFFTIKTVYKKQEVQLKWTAGILKTKRISV